MTAKIINGKEVARKYREELKQEVEFLKSKGITPGIAMVLVGNNIASHSYVKGKAKACREVGIYSEVIHLEETIQEHELIAIVEELNNREDIDGILVQLPLPSHIRDKAIIDHISEAKDVDGFSARNVGNMVIGDEGFLPCTPYGIIRLIQEVGVDIEGKHAVVVGRSNIVGKPVAMLLLQENATVTIAHSRTQNLADITRNADILVVAAGKAGLIGKEHVKPGAVVIDVGNSRGENGNLVGDVDFDSVVDIASYITPVPGGVGPMTITMLLKNTVEAARKNRLR